MRAQGGGKGGSGKGMCEVCLNTISSLAIESFYTRHG